MKNCEKVHWLKVHEYILKVEACRSIPEFLHTACTEVEEHISFDAAVGIFSTFDGRNLHGVGLSDATNGSYNNYYRTKQPGILAAEGDRLDPF